MEHLFGQCCHIFSLEFLGLGLLDLLVQQEQQVLKDQLVQLVLKVLRVHKEHKVFKAPQDQQGLLGHRVQLDQQEPLVLPLQSQVLLELLDQQVLHQR